MLGTWGFPPGVLGFINKRIKDKIKQKLKSNLLIRVYKENPKAGRLCILGRRRMKVSLEVSHTAGTGALEKQKPNRIS